MHVMLQSNKLNVLIFEYSCYFEFGQINMKSRHFLLSTSYHICHVLPLLLDVFGPDMFTPVDMFLFVQHISYFMRYFFYLNKKNVDSAKQCLKKCNEKQFVYYGPKIKFWMFVHVVVKY